jgi:hypothetical protein
VPTLLTQVCDRCPARIEFDPVTTKCFKYLIDNSMLTDQNGKNAIERTSSFVSGATKTILLPADWGVMELNVGHDKQVQCLCPGCVKLLRSFANDTDRQLPENTEKPKRVRKPRELKATKAKDNDGDEEKA